METETLLNFLKEKIDKWSKVEQSLQIGGQDVTLKPHYLSIGHREKDNYSMYVGDGDIASNSNNHANKKTGMYLRVLVGDHIQGYGEGIIGLEDIPLNHKSAISKMTDRNLDYILKNGLQFYLDLISANIIRKDPHLFEKISSEKVEQYSGSKLKREPISDELIQKTLFWSKEMSKLPFVLGAESKMNSSYERKCFVDSEGRTISEESHSGTVSIMATIEHEDSSRVNFAKSLVTNSDPQYLLALEDSMNESFNQIEMMRTASRIEGGQYPCVFSPQTVGTLTHEAFGAHLLSGRYIQNGTSTTFKGKIDQLIMPEFLTIIDNPQKQGSYGFYMFDDEGIRSQKVTLVQNGVLKNYLLDRKSAVFFGKKSNGHSRMGWVVHSNEVGNIMATLSEPRVSNLEIKSKNEVSESELTEIMKKHCKDKGIEFGLYIESSAGSVDVRDGNFHLTPSRAYKIFPNGKTEEIIDFFITGHPYNILKGITITGNVYKTTTGLCGASSGWVPTEEIAPSAFIKGVNIVSRDSQKYTRKLLD